MKISSSIQFLTFAAVTILLGTPVASWAQELYIANSGNNTVGEYDAATGATINSTLVSGLDAPNFLAVSGNDLYVVNSGNGTIGEYDAATGAPVNSSLITGLENPEFLAISGADLYVVNYSGTIGEYDAETGATINSSFITVTGPGAEALISGSDLFVASWGGGTVGEYNAVTGATINASFISGLNNPYGLALSGTDLFVSSEGFSMLQTVGEYNATTGETVDASFISGLSETSGIAVSGSDLYLTTGTNSVGEYDVSTGAVVTGSFISGLNYPSAIAISPVPEPGTWALVAGGVGLLGGMQRFRRARKMEAVIISQNEVQAFLAPLTSARWRYLCPTGRLPLASARSKVRLKRHVCRGVVAQPHTVTSISSRRRRPIFRGAARPVPRNARSTRWRRGRRA